ncbi:acyl-CoA carboxylase subunit epsilon [Streptomyces sp. NPDC001904]|uniref:acyl-CoA carboxylase subunit epsilon n=1 Tax=Streptomyces sp. NPDC001904 TaxID=3154531 RepID=UPI0033297853
MDKGSTALLRVERGRADAAELAALTAVLLMTVRGCQEAEEPPGAQEDSCSPWWVPEAGFAAPGSWRGRRVSSDLQDDHL